MNIIQPLDETFVFENVQSIENLSQNLRGQETSGRSYVQLLMLTLLNNGGVVTNKQLEQAVLRNFGSSFGPDDKRMIRVGRKGYRMTKWRNTLAWAKVMAKKKNLIAWRQMQRNGVKKKYIVMLAYNDQHRQFIDWAIERRSKPMGKIRLRRKPALKRHKIPERKRLDL